MQLSGVELRAIVRELDVCIGSRVAKLWQIEREVYIQFHHSEQGKRILRIAAPERMHTVLC